MKVCSRLPAIAFAMAGLLTHQPTFAVSCSDPGREAVSTCLRGLLQYHCGLLSAGNPGTLTDCASSSHSAVRLLNLENLLIPKDRSSGMQLHVAAFTDSLVPIFSSPATTRLLEGVREDLETSYRFDEPHSLWQKAGETAPDRSDRLRNLGVIFQSVTSVSGENLHFHLLKLQRVAKIYSLSRAHANQAQSIQKNISLYLELVSRIYQSKILRPSNPAFSLYPPLPKGIDLDPTLHHFYVPAHLARLLLKEGYRPVQAFFAAFLFNTLYELRKIDQKMGVGGWPYSYPGPLVSPAISSRIEINIHKIYTGYVGALFGVGKEAKAVSYLGFKSAFKTDPYGTMRRLMGTPL